MLRFFGVTALGLAIDLCAKSLAMAHLSTPGKVVQLVPGYIQFEYLRNHGAVFGIGQGDRIIFIVISIVAIAFLTFLFAGSGKQKMYQVLLGMLLAGVLGNLYDRIVYGYVRDMIHIFPRWPNLYPWVFNVADMLLCIGVAIMLIYGLFHREQAPSDEPA